MSTQSGANGDPVPRPESDQPPGAADRLPGRPAAGQPQPDPHAPGQPAASQPQPDPRAPGRPVAGQSQPDPHAPGQPAASQPQPDPHVPGQPPHQPPAPYPGPPHHHTPPPHGPNHQPLPQAAVTVPLGKMLYLCVAALGVINLFLGYVSAGDGDSMNLYKAAVAIYTLAPTMFFLAGLVAVREFLPRERPPGALPAMISTAIFVTLVLSAISSDGAGDLQTLFLVFGALQFVLAWLAYLFDSGVFAARR